MNEEWKDIENSNHQISNFGNVKNKGTLNKIISRNRIGKLKPKILKNRLSENKYLITFNNHLIHRLVAIYFLPNPNNLPEINHKDGNKLNNHISNLEWCTRSENQLHAYKTGLQRVNKNYERHGKIFRCNICNRFISYKEIPDNVKIVFTPDTEFTEEKIIFTHKKCLIQ